MAKMILAVSGGVDSIVLLDMMAKKYLSDDIIIAHFDHGIRGDSEKDAKFVAELAEKIYHIRYIIREGRLGENASEDTARVARYEFLRRVASENGGAKIYTAHHLDDLVETVAINFVRGTGWRGLAALDSADIKRPFLETEWFYEPMDKAAIIEYAAKRGLHWREDSTNTSDKYLRNRVRERIAEENLSFEKKLAIWELWQKQKALRREIDQSIRETLPEKEWQRSWFRELNKATALELLRAGILRAGISTTRPQLEEFRQAILNYAPGKCFNLPQDKLVKLKKDSFTI